MNTTKTITNLFEYYSLFLSEGFHLHSDEAKHRDRARQH